MRIGIFDPYLDTLGGGEKYILDIASYFASDNDVFIFWNDTSIKKRWEERFNIKSDNINITENIFLSKSNLLKRFFQTRCYDVIIYMSDGSIPFLFSKKNILIFQFPVHGINGKSLINDFKLKRINAVICYSTYVKSIIDKQYGFRSRVLPPYVDLQIAKNTEKENIILNVGRFTDGINAKKQEVLIDEFKRLYDSGIKNWKFVLIGSYLRDDEAFVRKIKDKIKQYPITLLANVSYDKLVEHYQKAKIYWHATGFGENLEKHPEKAEHFGISTVEAMRAGAVPVVINAGGQREIVENGKSGFLWNSLEELLGKTKDLIMREELWKKMSTSAIERSKIFNKNRFCNELKKIINE
ncbi:MAG: glycosyltransferase [Candidatus Levybacteria bacterium]|nr:glycosyltransferase [Candidatus Levybacteria bacterium]